MEDIAYFWAELFSLHDVVEHLVNFLLLHLLALTLVGSHGVSPGEQVLGLLILDSDKLIEQIDLEMFVLLKLAELLVEEGVECAVEGGLVAEVGDVVDDEVAVGEPRVVVVGAVDID